MSFPRFVSTAIAALLLACQAYAGTPRVTHAYPSGGQRGTEVDVVFGGSNLADARDVLFDEPGFQVTTVKNEPARFTTKVKIAPEARVGEHLYRVVTGSGISDLRLFYVSPFPMVEEKKEKANPDKPQPVELNTTVYGHTPAATQSHYLVEAKKGQRLTAEVIGCRLQTQSIYDPLVQIAREDGTLLTEVDDTVFGRQDPVASVIVPEDGKYLVTIKESTNSGLGECHYLMHIGTFAQPLAVYPAGGPVGQELEVQLLGDASGPIATKVKVPAETAERFELLANADGGSAPMPNFLRASKFPNVLESEPNNDVAHATPAPADLPIALNGIISEKGDVDYFKITAKKGQAYDLSVFARQLRSPLDSVLTIYNAKGIKLAENDDDGMPDSHLRWSAPADGEFFVSVTDQLSRGGPLFFYRVEITPVEPRLTAWLPEMVINSSQERRAIPVPQGNRYASLLRIKRLDVAGEVQVAPEGLPDGVQWNAGAIDKAVDTIPVVFEAAPQAALAAKEFKVAAKLTEPPKDGPAVTSGVEQKVDIIENGNQKAFYSVMENRLPLAVTDPVPVRLTLLQPKVPILQSGSMELKVKVERTGDYKGPVALSLLYNPPGIGSAGPGQLKEGDEVGTVTISCTDKATTQKWKICVVGTVDLGKGPVWISSQLVDLEVAAPFVAGKIQRTFIDQGDTGSIVVKLDQNTPFDGKAKVILQGLPQGITAQEREITKDDKEIKFDLKAEPGATVGQHRALFCQFQLSRDGEEMLNTFAQGGVLRVDKAAVAKNEPPK